MALCLIFFTFSVTFCRADIVLATQKFISLFLLSFNLSLTKQLLSILGCWFDLFLSSESKLIKPFIICSRAADY